MVRGIKHFFAKIRATQDYSEKQKMGLAYEELSFLYCTYNITLNFALIIGIEAIPRKPASKRRGCQCFSCRRDVFLQERRLLEVNLRSLCPILSYFWHSCLNEVGVICGR